MAMILFVFVGIVAVLTTLFMHYRQHFTFHAFKRIPRISKKYVGAQSNSVFSQNGLRIRHNSPSVAKFRYKRKCFCRLTSKNEEEFNFFPISFLFYVMFVTFLCVLPIIIGILYIIIDTKSSSLTISTIIDINSYHSHTMNEMDLNNHNQNKKRITIFIIDYMLVYGVMIIALWESLFSFYRYYTTVFSATSLNMLTTSQVLTKYSPYPVIFSIIYIIEMNFYFFIFPLVVVLHFLFNFYCNWKFASMLINRYNIISDLDDNMNDVHSDILNTVYFIRKASIILCILQTIYLSIFVISYNVKIIYYLPLLWGLSSFIFSLNFVRNKKLVQNKYASIKNKLCKCRIKTVRSKKVNTHKNLTVDIKETCTPQTNIIHIHSDSKSKPPLPKRSSLHTYNTRKNSLHETKQTLAVEDNINKTNISKDPQTTDGKQQEFTLQINTDLLTVDRYEDKTKIKDYDSPFQRSPSNTKRNGKALALLGISLTNHAKPPTRFKLSPRQAYLKKRNQSAKKPHVSPRKFRWSPKKKKRTAKSPSKPSQSKPSPMQYQNDDDNDNITEFKYPVAGLSYFNPDDIIPEKQEKQNDESNNTLPDFVVQSSMKSDHNDDDQELRLTPTNSKSKSKSGLRIHNVIHILKPNQSNTSNKSNKHSNSSNKKKHDKNVPFLKQKSRSQPILKLQHDSPNKNNVADLQNKFVYMSDDDDDDDDNDAYISNSINKIKQKIKKMGTPTKPSDGSQPSYSNVPHPPNDQANGVDPTVPRHRINLQSTEFHYAVNFEDEMQVDDDIVIGDDDDDDDSLRESEDDFDVQYQSDKPRPDNISIGEWNIDIEQVHNPHYNSYNNSPTQLQGNNNFLNNTKEFIKSWSIGPERENKPIKMQNALQSFNFMSAYGFVSSTEINSKMELRKYQVQQQLKEHNKKQTIKFTKKTKAKSAGNSDLNNNQSNSPKKPIKFNQSKKKNIKTVKFNEHTNSYGPKPAKTMNTTVDTNKKQFSKNLTNKKRQIKKGNSAVSLFKLTFLSKK